MRSKVFQVLALLVFTSSLQAQPSELSKAVKEFVRVDASKVVLTHVRVIDGTGAPAMEDQNVLIEDGRIAAIQKGAEPQFSPSTDTR